MAPLGKYVKNAITVNVFKAVENTQIVTIVDGKCESIKYVKAGDLVIEGVKGELYPIDHDVFEQTYKKFIDAMPGK